MSSRPSPMLVKKKKAKAALIWRYFSSEWRSDYQKDHCWFCQGKTTPDGSTWHNCSQLEVRQKKSLTWVLQVAPGWNPDPWGLVRVLLLWNLHYFCSFDEQRPLSTPPPPSSGFLKLCTEPGAPRDPPSTSGFCAPKPSFLPSVLQRHRADRLR